MIFAGDVDGSISAARDDFYEKPGAKPEYRFSGIMEDLRRRDFSINAIAISLNTQSRGLLLDPTNGLADLEKQEVRALSIHAFTNQPIRLMRIFATARAWISGWNRARRNGSTWRWSAGCRRTWRRGCGQRSAVACARR